MNRQSPKQVLVEITPEHGLRECRFQTRRLCAAMGFSGADTDAITTCVTELARNIESYAGRGTVLLEETQKGGEACLRIHASDDGPGIPHLDEVLSGKYRSRTGLGRGLLGVKRLADECTVSARPGGGTMIDLIKYLRRG